ncbi:MAG: six-hairpin glycosidase, partial [Alistipes sp.]|nr:six-hairpin glycosidase [Alistipes sp.]
MRDKILQLMVLALLPAFAAAGQTGSPAEPVRYIGGEITDPDVHDGGFRYVVGVENIQVLRANRTDPAQAEDYGWTYNHAPNLTYWRGNFYLQYLSNPADEHVSPGQTLLAVSPDGRQWGNPV